MVKFGIIGDMGTGGNNQYKIAESLKKLIDRDNLSFICGLGDNIYKHKKNILYNYIKYE